MTISKATPTALRHHDGTYVTVPSDTIDALKLPESLAILVYLLDRPADWIIRREHIRARFSIGKDRYAKAMKELQSNGLAWKEFERDPATGRITRTIMCLSAYTEKPDIRTVGKTSPPENPTDGKSGHLHITDLSTQNKSNTVPAVKPAGPRRMPADWSPDDKTLARAVDLGHQHSNYDSILEEFVDYWHHSTTRRKDWNKTFLARLKQIHERKLRKGAVHGKPASGSQIIADDLAETLAH